MNSLKMVLMMTMRMKMMMKNMVMTKKMLIRPFKSYSVAQHTFTVRLLKSWEISQKLPRTFFTLIDSRFRINNKLPERQSPCFSFSF